MEQKAIFRTKIVAKNQDYTSHNGEIVTIINSKEYRDETRYDIKFKNGEIAKNIMDCELSILESDRHCYECDKEMYSGYVIENGMEYYCSEECLHKHYTEEEFLQMYDDGNGDSYWTEWED